ncbi:MAG: UDP-2,3-diacylglucosamine diphosphatase [Ignavibacteriales bacterium]|nr:UDP-2,3-diacylglucosamine diphosphatase [Ignavibacteriales bacterium]
MSKIFFISDVHLGLGNKQEEEQKRENLFSFLDYVLLNGNELFILGDLFDVWFEYKQVIPKGHHRILTKLEDLTRKKIVVHYLLGNHDYWNEDYFEKELGVKVYHEPFEKTIDGKRLYFHHGDGLAQNDTGYLILKKILRNPFIISLYKKILHPDFGITLATSSSHKSRNYTSHKHYGEQDGMLLFAKEKFREGLDVVMMGHNHEPKLVEENGKLYVNLGDWISHFTYGELKNGKFEMKVWKGVME